MNTTMNLYAIYDVKADAIQAELFPFPNDDMAKRGFAGAFKNPRFGMIADFPDDFFVYKVGVLALEGTGKLLSQDPERICSFSVLKGEN